MLKTKIQDNPNNKIKKNSKKDITVTKKDDIKTRSDSHNEMLAVILVRGRVGISPKIRTTLDSLKLLKKNNCVIIPKTKTYLGMLAIVKSYVTWGEINKETLNLIEKLDKKNNVYRLHPPIKGFERKGIKKSFSIGGALGYRGKKINDLLKRMI